MRVTRTRLTIVYISLTILGLIFAGQSRAEIAPESVVGIWFFDEGKGDTAKDSSNNGNDGKLEGRLKWVDGKFGKALDFNGTDAYVDCGNNASLDITGNLTVAVWTYWRGEVGHVWQGVVAKGHSSNPEEKYSLTFNKQESRFLPELTGANIGWCDFSWFPDLKDKWVHGAFTFDGQVVSAYINGKQLTPDFPFVEKALGITTEPLYIGQGNLGEYFDGIIDEVAIFSSALTEADIMRIATEGLSKAFVVDSSGKLAETWASIKNL